MDGIRLPLYLGFLLVGFLLWQRWEEASAPPPAPTQQAAPHAAATDAPSAIPSDAPNNAAPDATPSPALDDLPDAVDAPRTATPEAAPDPVRAESNNRIRVVTDLLDLDILPAGGDIVRLDFPQVARSVEDPTPFRLFENANTTYIAQSGLLHDRVANVPNLKARAPSHRANFTAAQNLYELNDQVDHLRVPLVWNGPDGLVVEKNYIFQRDSYVITIEHVVRNQSDQAWTGRQYRQLRRASPREEGSQLLYTFTGASYYDDQFIKIEFEEFHEDTLSQTLRNSWVAMLQHYFVSAFLPNADAEEYIYSRAVRTPIATEYIIGMRSESLAVPAGETGRLKTRLYAGPKIQSRLEKAAPGLHLTVDYGVLTIIAQPMFYALEFIHDWVGNWGVAIILITILIKLAFYKLSEMSYRSMARMRKFQPRFTALREKYKGNREQMNKAVMELYRTEKINPLGGCLPIILQVPFFIALYWTLLESAELRQAPFIFWLQDLSVRDPYFVLPLIMGATMIFQMRLNPTPPDPMQAKVMKYMPYVFTLFFAFFPSGLVLYWSVNNLLSIAQQWHITRQIERAD